MQRDWKIIKAVLMELEPLNSVEGKNYQVHYTGDQGNRTIKPYRIEPAHDNQDFEKP